MKKVASNEWWSESDDGRFIIKLEKNSYVVHEKDPSADIWNRFPPVAFCATLAVAIQYIRDAQKVSQ